jgi:predicted MFS family arabinose efflux permease
VRIPIFSWIWRQYRSAFEGLSQEAWVLATVMFINRAGTMVLPFLGLYLREGLGFSLADTGWIMATYGVGSMVGALLGGCHFHGNRETTGVIAGVYNASAT